MYRANSSSAIRLRSLADTAQKDTRLPLSTESTLFQSRARGYTRFEFMLIHKYEKGLVESQGLTDLSDDFC